MDQEMALQLRAEREKQQEREQVHEVTQKKLKEEIAALQNSLAAEQTAHKATKQELASLTSQHAQLNESRTTLKRALERAGAERATAWEQSANEAELSRRLGVKVADLQKQNEALLHELSLLRNHATQAQNCNPAEVARLIDEKEQLSKSVTETEMKYQSRSTEYFTLLNRHDALLAERKELEAEKQRYEVLKRSSTPRPQWRRLLEKSYLPDSCNIAVQSSDSLIDELCCEIDRLRASLHAWEMKYPTEGELEELESKIKTDGVKKPAALYLKSLGSGPDVPRYLAWGKAGAKIRNQNIPKRQTELLIKECWAMKLHTPDEEGGAEYRRMTLQEFLYVFLKKKAGFQEAIAALAYSLLDALERFRFDGDCDLFLNILHGELSEAVYVDQFRMLDDLKAALQEADAAYHKGRIKAIVPRKIVLDLLSRFFLPPRGAKSDTNLRKLNRALIVTDRSDMVN